MLYNVNYHRSIIDNFYPDLSALAVAHGNLVVLWDLAEDSLKAALSSRQLQGGNINSVAFGAPSAPLTLLCASKSALCSWDLLGCRVAWSAQLERPRIIKASPDSVLVSCIHALFSEFSHVNLD